MLATSKQTFSQRVLLPYLRWRFPIAQVVSLRETPAQLAIVVANDGITAGLAAPMFVQRKLQLDQFDCPVFEICRVRNPGKHRAYKILMSIAPMVVRWEESRRRKRQLEEEILKLEKLVEAMALSQLYEAEEYQQLCQTKLAAYRQRLRLHTQFEQSVDAYITALMISERMQGLAEGVGIALPAPAKLQEQKQLVSTLERQLHQTREAGPIDARLFDPTRTDIPPAAIEPATEGTLGASEGDRSSSLFGKRPEQQFSNPSQRAGS